MADAAEGGREERMDGGREAGKEEGKSSFDVLQVSDVYWMPRSINSSSLSAGNTDNANVKYAGNLVGLSLTLPPSLLLHHIDSLSSILLLLLPSISSIVRILSASTIYSGVSPNAYLNLLPRLSEIVLNTVVAGNEDVQQASLALLITMIENSSKGREGWRDGSGGGGDLVTATKGGGSDGGSFFSMKGGIMSRGGKEGGKKVSLPAKKVPHA